MLHLADAVRTDFVIDSGIKRNGKPYSNRVVRYWFNCTGCGKEIAVRKSDLAKHMGRCLPCVIRGLARRAR